MHYSWYFCRFSFSPFFQVCYVNIDQSYALSLRFVYTMKRRISLVSVVYVDFK